MHVTDLSADLRRALEHPRRNGFTVVIDALDEAHNSRHSRQIIRHIARPLAEDLHHLGVRVVVGTRRKDDAGSLLDALASPHVIDLDSPRYFAHADLAAYSLATLRLRGHERPGNPYNAAAEAAPVAERIAQPADRNFLVAGLIARAHGMHDRRPVVTEELRFTPTVDAALASYLELLPSTDDVPATALMTALAYAEAPGLPVPLWQSATARHPVDRLASWRGGAVARWRGGAVASDRRRRRLPEPVSCRTATPPPFGSQGR